MFLIFYTTLSVFLIFSPWRLHHSFVPISHSDVRTTPLVLLVSFHATFCSVFFFFLILMSIVFLIRNYFGSSDSITLLLLTTQRLCSVPDILTSQEILHLFICTHPRTDHKLGRSFHFDRLQPEQLWVLLHQHPTVLHHHHCRTLKQVHKHLIGPAGSNSLPVQRTPAAECSSGRQLCSLMPS